MFGDTTVTLWAWVRRVLVLGLASNFSWRGVTADGGGVADDVQVAWAQGSLKTVAEGRDSQARLWRGAGTGASRRLPSFTAGKLGESYDVKERASTAAVQEQQVLNKGTIANPPAWDSSLCLAHWGPTQDLNKADPNGYLIFVTGREQLGGNKHLVADGMFVAKALNRTFVEYPVKDARVESFDISTIGLGAYWDLSELCMYHRIVDLQRFRNMMSNGILPAEGFLTIRSDQTEVFLKEAKEEKDVVEIFKKYKNTQVIVLERAWKSGRKRDSLQYLRPNPFYMGIVRMLMEQQKDWGGGKFLALQWRTELSTGNLTECYREIKSAIELEREKLGFGSHQVLVNTDLYGKTSGTFTATAQQAGAAVLDLISKDYPNAFDNRLHHFFGEIEDSGVRAFVSGLVVASSEVMLGSSLNDPDCKRLPEASKCQKPFSGYIELITEWRENVVGKNADSVVRLFPFEREECKAYKEP